jgi:hypothetical protein
MRIRLHEIELGSSDTTTSSSLLQTILGLPAKLKQPELTVLDPGITGVDLNISAHFPAGTAALSFLTDDLKEIERRLQKAGVVYEGPRSSHLGMTTIQFRDGAGYIIRINTPGDESPGWLRVH